MKKSPVAFFAYKRPKHTLRSLESLAQNEGVQNTELFVFCDAPKKPEDLEAVKEVREIVKSKQWCGSVQVIERETNWGLANSIISGVTELCQEYGRVIVIEDDLVLSPFFLDYMNRALERYQDTPQVMQISGHMFPIKLEVETDAVFLPLTTSWGWATWERAWQYFDTNMPQYDEIKNNKLVRYQFNLNSSYNYWKMLEQQKRGKIDSWAICWYLNVFMQKSLVLFPTQSLVKNMGFDGSGTHTRKNIDSQKYNSGLTKTKVMLFPDSLEINTEVYLAITEFLKNISRRSRSRHLVNDLFNWFKKIELG